MRPWMFLGVILLGCSGGSSDGHNKSALFVLCFQACAHIRAKNCVDAPAVATSSCSTECAAADSEVPTECADERAELYVCTAEAEIICGGGLQGTPEVQGCEKEQLALDGCKSPEGACMRSPSSDIICEMFGGMNFYQCSEGQMPMNGPPCIPVTVDGFCCPL